MRSSPRSRGSSPGQGVEQQLEHDALGEHSHGDRANRDLARNGPVGLGHRADGARADGADLAARDVSPAASHPLGRLVARIGALVHPVLALSGAASPGTSPATGVVTLGFLTASVLLGILTSFRWSSATWPRFVVEFVHRNVSLLVLVFLAIHVVTVVLDSFAPIRWIDVLVPFISAYRPFWLGLGAIALDLLLALVVTSLLRHRIGFRAWRLVHWMAYACWPVAVLHGSRYRVGHHVRPRARVHRRVRRRGPRRRRTAHRRGLAARPGPLRLGLGLVAFAPVLLVVWLVSGPLAERLGPQGRDPGQRPRHGVGHDRSGTTAVTAAARPPAGRPRPRRPAPSPAVGFDATTQGTVTQSSSRSERQVVRLTCKGPLAGGSSGTLDVELTGAPLAGGGVSMRSGTVTLSDGTHSYQGSVIGLRDVQIIADMPGPGGASWQVIVDVTRWTSSTAR